MDNWCTIECRSNIFSQMIKEFGVNNIEVEDVYDMS